MDTRREVALFVDLENIREGVRQVYGAEIRPTLLIEKARKYGLVNIARAYADLEGVPQEVQREMQICGLTAINAPTHVVGGRRRSAADLDLLVDLIEAMLDRATIPTVLLMSGDRDFLRVVTMVRNRFGKEIVICGVPGTVSPDLIEAAGGNYDPLEIPGLERHAPAEMATANGDRPAASERAPRRVERVERAPRGERPGRERGRSAYGRRPGPRSRGEGERPRLPQPDVAEELGAADASTEATPTWQRGKLAERAEQISKMMAERRAAGEPVPPAWSGQPEFTVGDVVEGTVKSITDFGAFLDIGGVDALLHVSQMAWQHVRHPGQVVNIGDVLSVKVLEMDAENGRVSVGLKQLTPDPWLDAGDKYEVGKRVRGRVSGVKEYGVFIELQPGIFGLLHISNLFEQPWGHHPSERYALDQELEVTVSKIDPEMRRLAFVLPGSPAEAALREQVAPEPAAAEDDEEAAEAALRFREGEEMSG